VPPLQPDRGTRDLLAKEQRAHRHVIDTASRIAALYGFAEWSTPIFEETAVFARTLGETSDVVSKEMYTFQDRGGDSITLRPEGTAGVCRALVSNGLTQSLPQKVFYAGPMFRYERPQKGRYRQFHQIGLELIGPAEPMADAEVIACGYRILYELGLEGNVKLQLNTLGDTQSRADYRNELVAYFNLARGRLSEDSLLRLDRNPLRILDSKDEGDRAIVAQAPTIEAFLSIGARKFWNDLQEYLKAFGIAFEPNWRIVRGLDYYSHTAFEFVTDALGAQGTVLAGGRYDGLVAEMGGPPTPAVGWAAGVDRLALLLKSIADEKPLVTVVPAEGFPEKRAVHELQILRAGGIRSEMAYSGNVKKRMQRANRAGARFAVILNDATVERDIAQLKDLTDGSQVDIHLSDLPAKLKA
jgi:histidyl-tRNA synthetase